MKACPACLVGLLIHGLVAAQDNVLILLADDLGVDALASYGEGANPPPTPNIDALAQNGVLFRNCWSNPLCSPSRALIHTGRYAFRTGLGTVVVWNTPLPALLPEEVTLPELLDHQRSGYAHAAIGKWHLSTSQYGGALGPNRAGWSHFAGETWNPGSYYSWTRTVNGIGAASTTYMTTQNVDDAVAWIRSAPEPWVCYLAFFAPHRPYHAPPPHLHTRNLTGLHPQQDPIPFFHAMVEAMDTEIGRLFREVGPSVMGRTNVIFTSDNGTDWPVTEPPFVSQHGKGTVYEGGVNVPLIVSGPAVGQPGREEDALVSLVDLYPTVAELCGVDATPPYRKIDGVSFLRHLAAPNRPPVRTMVYTEVFYRTDPGPVAIRGTTHKLIRRYELTPPRDELYDLRLDPFEQDDLLQRALTVEEQAAYAALGDRLTALRDTSGRITRYGYSECRGSNGFPRLSWSGVPEIGATYTISLANGAPAQAVALLTGASRSRWGPWPLPYSLGLAGGAPSCFFYASGEVHVPAMTDPSGAVSVSTRLPHQMALVAATLYHQFLVIDPLAPGNPLGMTTSDAAAVTIGGPSP